MSSEIHTYRERIANQLSDFEIWNEVLINILQINGTLEDKIDLIAQAMPDLQKALTHLHYCYKNGLISEKDYRLLSNQVLIKKTFKQDSTVLEKLKNYQL